ncbi:MAG: hypothetical protein LBM75_05400 [Myxococcales bacterium]|jgi:phenylpyruvate tautomerase PptA (4-oxalocrotonate tautomerase family)|nr:hypothetical protein [Myxococcales bacterium]
MPLLKIETSAPLNDDRQVERVLQESSRIVADLLHKPEQYVMVALSPVAMLMSAAGGPAAFCDLRSIGGIEPDACQALSQALCALLETTLQIAPERIYLNFAEFDAASWGWNGTTFG